MTETQIDAVLLPHDMANNKTQQRFDRKDVGEVAHHCHWLHQGTA